MTISPFPISRVALLFSSVHPCAPGQVGDIPCALRYRPTRIDELEHRDKQVHYICIPQKTLLTPVPVPFTLVIPLAFSFLPNTHLSLLCTLLPYIYISHIQSFAKPYRPLLCSSVLPAIFAPRFLRLVS